MTRWTWRQRLTIRVVRWTRRWLGLAVLLSVATAVLAAPSDAREAYQFRVIEHNIAGGAMNNGDPDALGNVDQQIGVWHPDAVMLEEVCASQRDAFAAEHPDWAVLFSPMRTESPKCPDGTQGQLLASPWPITYVSITDLGDAGPAKSYTLLCGRVNAPTPARVCVTHLPAYGVDLSMSRQRQTAIIASTLAPYEDAGHTAIVGGDLNSIPTAPALDGLYRDYREGDSTDRRFCDEGYCRTGEATTDNGRKIDYVFFSHGPSVSGGVIGSGTSDHDLYRAAVNLG